MNEMDELYFKDSFTQDENGINLEINHLEVGCITSSNDNFSLDEQGNLTVKSITTTNSSQNLPDILNAAYPVGSIYISVNDTNPTNYFGGVWTAFGQGKTLVGLDSNQAEFDTVLKTGGEKGHTLSVSEMPTHNHSTSSDGAHNHRGRYRYGTVGTGNLNFLRRISNDDAYTADDVVTYWDGAHNHTITSTGGNLSHNNLQPYITVYMWQRTA